jgi:glutamate formiminotransferase / formiminotetrahydrofolate cyclodeaminase
MDQLLKMVDEDTNAFNRIMDALSLPKKTEADKAVRKKAIQDATKFATEVPLKTMELCYSSMEVMLEMAEKGNPNSVSDAGVGAIAARGGVYGAYLNVRINAKGIEDVEYANKIVSKADELLAESLKLEQLIIDKVISVMGR